MTGRESPYAALPRTRDVPHPSTSALYRLRGPAARFIRRRFDIHLHHEERVPLHGPVILAANHTGWYDGPFMTVLSPRPAHVLTKEEMFEGRGRWFFEWAGQIELDRRNPDPAAVKTSLRVLRAGRALGIFPEGARGNGEYDRIRGGTAYLALVTGAPVVPVTLFGTRQPGEDSHAKPAKGARIDIVYGEAWRVDPQPWPRRRADVAAATADLHEHLRACLAEAKQITGRTLPGPLPAGDDEAAEAARQDHLP